MKKTPNKEEEAQTKASWSETKVSIKTNLWKKGPLSMLYK
jgi:hypothetical protein